MATTTTTTLATPPIFNLMVATGPTDYYDADFRQVLEDHMTYLRNVNTTTLVTVSAQQVWENDQDLFGYLQTVLVMPLQYHWVTMRLNDYTSPDQFTEGVTQLLIPSSTTLEQLRSAWKTSSTSSS